MSQKLWRKFQQMKKVFLKAVRNKACMLFKQFMIAISIHLELLIVNIKINYIVDTSITMV